MGVCEPLSSSLVEEPLLPCNSFNWDATVEIGVAGTHRDSYFYLTLYTFNLQVNDHARPLCLDTAWVANTTDLSFNAFTSIFPANNPYVVPSSILKVEMHFGMPSTTRFWMYCTWIWLGSAGVVHSSGTHFWILLISESWVRFFGKVHVEFAGRFKT